MFTISVIPTLAQLPWEILRNSSVAYVWPRKKNDHLVMAEKSRIEAFINVSRPITLELMDWNCDASVLLVMLRLSVLPGSSTA